MEVRFYNGRKKVFTVMATSINGAISLIDDQEIEWTRYEIY